MLCIVPTIFAQDLLQESDALLVVEKRLKSLKSRTSAILETVSLTSPLSRGQSVAETDFMCPGVQTMDLMAVKQARLASKMTELQMKDAQLSFTQNESIRRLTVVNMVYLPATFIAVSP